MSNSPDQSTEAAIGLSTFRCTDGSSGVKLAIEINGKNREMVMTENETWIAAGRLESEGIFEFRDVDREPLDMFLDPPEAQLLADALRKAAELAGSLAKLDVSCGPNLSGVVQ